MKNREKYAKEILDIACKGLEFAVTKSSKITYCSQISCKKCIFKSPKDSEKTCRIKRCEWAESEAESEYVKKPTITTKEKLFLDLIKEEYAYIARDEDGLLAAYTRKPEKKTTYWLVSDIPNSTKDLYIRALNVSFDFIKWEDEEPWSIDDLKKLEVEDK